MDIVRTKKYERPDIDECPCENQQEKQSSEMLLRPVRWSFVSSALPKGLPQQTTANELRGPKCDEGSSIQEHFNGVLRKLYQGQKPEDAYAS